MRLVGKQRLVLDLSCRKRDDGAYYVVTDKWQKFSELQVRWTRVFFFWVGRRVPQGCCKHVGGFWMREGCRVWRVAAGALEGVSHSEGLCKSVELRSRGMQCGGGGSAALGGR